MRTVLQVAACALCVATVSTVASITRAEPKASSGMPPLPPPSSGAASPAAAPALPAPPAGPAPTGGASDGAPPAASAPSVPVPVAAPSQANDGSTAPPPAPLGGDAMPRRWRLPSVVVAPHGPVDEDAEPVAPPPRDWGERVGRLELGYRALFVTNSGYNPYATNDYLGAVSLAASRTVIAEGAFALALGVAWDYGWTSATARTDAASLHFQTLSIPIEARAHAGRWGFAFVRVAPGLANERAELDDATAPSSLTRSAWLFAVDAGAGYAFPVLPIPPARGRLPRVWLVAEGGYTWTPDVRMTLAPRDASHAADVDLGTLGMRGATLRFALAVSY